MIIALAGNMGVGKDTVADVLEKNHGFRRTSFALALKNLCIRLFEFDQRTMFGPSELRNEPDPRFPTDEYWQRVYRNVNDHSANIRLMFPFTELSKPYGELMRTVRGFQARGAKLTPRYVLQHMGTNWARNLDADVWLNAVKKQIENDNPYGHWVITDCRFPNEAEFVRNRMNGQVWWVDASKRVKRGPEFTHASEPDYTDLETWVSAIVENNAGISDLREAVEKTLRRRLTP